MAPEVAETIRTFVESALDELGVPGAAVVVVREDGLAYAEGFGRADDSGRPVTPQTPFRIASLSKQLTAIAIRQLIDSDALSLDSAVRDHLPWFGDGVSALVPVTVRDLLAHTAGWRERDGHPALVDSSTDDEALERNAHRIAGVEPTLPIGQFEYTNAGYDILAHLVAKLSGRSFERYLQEHVLAPLDMGHTHVDLTAAQADGLAQGHYRFFGVMVPFEAPFSRGALGSASVMSSAEDLGRLLAAHLSPDGVPGLLPAETLADLRRPLSTPSAGSGYGWGLWTYPLYEAGALVDEGSTQVYQAPVVHEHTGSMLSFASGTVLLPEAGYGVVVLMNHNDEVASSRFYQIHTGIAMILMGLTPPALTFYEEPLRVYGKVLVLGALALQLIGVFFALRRLRGWRVHRPPDASTAGWRARHLALPLALDIGGPLLLWWLYLDSAALQPTDISYLVQLVPDMTIGLLLVLALGIGWAVARTWLTLRAMGAPRRA